jgi:hypothetical protein
MAKKQRITTKKPIEPSHLNEYSPGSLQLPDVGDIWGENADDWKASFLMWKNHGYTNEGNRIIGYLDLQQESTGNDRCTISFYEKRVHQGGRENIIEGHVITDVTQFYLPLEWDLKSRFITPEGKIIPELNYHQKAVVESDKIIRITNKKRFVEEKPEQVVHEFGLIRYMFEPGFTIENIGSFTFLENGLIPKSGHTISGTPELNQTYENRQLKCYVQFGYGINPIEYYLDENNLLCAAISSFRAKICNQHAAEYYNEFVSGSFNN